MIKKLFPVFLLSLTLVSCLDSIDSDYAPQLVFPTTFFRNTTDSVRLRQDAEGLRLDTIALGDTIRFYVGFDALGNTLQQAQVSWDSIATDLTFTVSDGLQNILLPTSDITKGVFDITSNPKVRAISLLVEFVAIQKGTPIITFTVRSDSKYSPSQIKLKTPIK